MTYNFDPDRWFEIESDALKALLARGEISDKDFDLAMEKLAVRYDEMLTRIDIRHDYDSD